MPTLIVREAGDDTSITDPNMAEKTMVPTKMSSLPPQLGMPENALLEKTWLIRVDANSQYHIRFNTTGTNSANAAARTYGALFERGIKP